MIGIQIGQIHSASGGRWEDVCKGMSLRHRANVPSFWHWQPHMSR